MLLPGVSVNVSDNALGIVSQGGSQVQVKLSVCTAGVPNTLYSSSSLSNLQSQIGLGPLVSAAGSVLSVAGGPVLCMPVNPSQFGYAGSVTHSGTGTGSIVINLAPVETLTFTVSTGGALGTAKATVALGTGAASQPFTLPTTNSYSVPGAMFTVMNFGAGTYVQGDTYEVGTDGYITHTGGGVPTVTQQSSPVDSFNVLVTITKSGLPGAGAFTYSLDGGTTTSAPITIPVSERYAIPNSGISLEFSGTYVANDTYSFLTSAPSFNGTDVTAAYAKLQTTYLSNAYFLIHVIGGSTSASGAETLASTLATQTSTLVSSYKYVRTLMECPTVGSIITSGSAAIADTADDDTTVETAFTNLNSALVLVAAGDEELSDPVTGLTMRRNGAWSMAAKASAVNAAHDLGRTADGGLTGVSAIHRDEGATTALDQQRFCTLRTFLGLSGFYITNAKTMALVTSDFARFANARVIDEACTVAYAALLLYVNDQVATKADGTIAEKEARRIEAQVTNKLKAGLVAKSPQDAVDVSVSVDRTNNILSDSTLNVTIRVQPFGYSEFITADIGFKL